MNRFKLYLLQLFQQSSLCTVSSFCIVLNQAIPYALDLLFCNILYQLIAVVTEFVECYPLSICEGNHIISHPNITSIVVDLLCQISTCCCSFFCKLVPFFADTRSVEEICESLLSFLIENLCFIRIPPIHCFLYAFFECLHEQIHPLSLHE